MPKQQPATKFHQIPVKMGEREGGVFMLHEHVASGKVEGREVNINRGVNGQLIMITIGEKTYLLDMMDTVEAIVAWEKTQ